MILKLSVELQALAQWFRVLTALPEDLSLVPSTTVRHLTASVIPALGDPTPSSDLFRHLPQIAHGAHTHM